MAQSEGKSVQQFGDHPASRGRRAIPGSFASLELCDGVLACYVIVRIRIIDFHWYASHSLARLEVAVFVESDVEIKIKDRSTQMMDEHELKLWVQRAFKDVSCYRIENFQKVDKANVKARVAVNTSALPDTEREMLESRPNDITALRSFVERMFVGKGTCRTVGEPALKES